MRKLLDITFDCPKTLEDIGLTMTTVEQVNQTLLNLFCSDSTTGQVAVQQDLGTGEPTQPSSEGPFQDQLRNDVWR
eukprot:1911177-Rhodomonas_salina.1